MSVLVATSIPAHAKIDEVETNSNEGLGLVRSATAQLDRPIPLIERFRIRLYQSGVWMVGSGPYLASINILGQTAQPQAVPPLLRVLSDRSSPCRAEAARALAQVPNPMAVSPLIEALRDPDPDVRAEALQALTTQVGARIVDRQAERDIVGRIARLLRTDPKLSVRLKAYDALRWLGLDEEVLLVLSQAAGSSHVFGFVLTCRSIRNYALATSVWKKEPDKRQAAKRLLRILKQEDGWVARSPLLRTYFASRFYCGSPRVEAARGLGVLRVRFATPELIRIAGASSDSELRMAAIESLGKIRGDGAFETLAKALGDPNPTVRRTATEALGRSGDPRAASLLLGVLAGGSEYDRVSAAGALGSFPGHAEALVRALGDEVVQVRVAAEASLLKTAGENTVESLIKALSDPNERVRLDAALLLADLHGEASRAGLVEVLRRGEQPSGSLAALALGLRGEPESRPALEQALKDSKSAEILPLVHALQDLNEPASLPRLRMLLKNAPTPEVEAATKLAIRVLEHAVPTGP